MKFCKGLNDEFLKLVNKAEEKDHMSLVIKANGIERKSEEKSKIFSLLEETIAIISKKRENYKIKFDTRVTDIMFQLFFCRKPIKILIFQCEICFYIFASSQIYSKD